MTTRNRPSHANRRPPRRRIILALLGAWICAALVPPEASAQVSGVRGFDGGVAPLFNVVGPGNYYIDGSGTQGHIYNFGLFQSYSFNTPGGQAWAGAQGTLGPQLSIGLIQGANQPGAPVLLTPPPRQLSPAPRIQSTLLDFLDEIP